MIETYDAIVIGAGHNGLVTAALLAKGGLKVLALEARDTIGGLAATEEVFPGFKFNTGADDAGLFLPKITKELPLEQHGLAFIDSPAAVYAPHTNGSSLTIWQDPQRTQNEIARFSKPDAQKYPAFLEHTKKLSNVLSNLMTLTPPDVFAAGTIDLIPWIKTALGVRQMGGKDMMALLRVLPMTAKEFLDEWFENDFLKGVLGVPSVTGSMQGPQSAGTAFMLLYQQSGEQNGGYRSSRFVKGGVGELANAIRSAAVQYGVEVRTSSKVQRIILDGDQAAGVALEDGHQFKSKLVISNSDPQATLLGLVGAENMGVRVARRARNIKFRGSTAKINLALSDLPIFTATPPSVEHLGGYIVVSPSLEHIERAYDDAKYGHISKSPVLEIRIPSILDETIAPEGRHIMSINVRFAPYKLRGSDWGAQRKNLGNHVIDALKSHIPDLKDLILHRQVVTPHDYEKEYHATEGNIFHGQMGLDQLLIMRPLAGYAQYRTPIKNLYLCGAGAHPGGGVSGAPGYNAARQILKDV